MHACFNQTEPSDTVNFCPCTIINCLIHIEETCWKVFSMIKLNKDFIIQVLLPGEAITDLVFISMYEEQTECKTQSS